MVAQSEYDQIETETEGNVLGVANTRLRELMEKLMIAAEQEDES